MCQKFLPKIKFGDKRVFIINGKVCGAISRVPKKGSFLSNMSKGAIPISVKLTTLESLINKLSGVMNITATNASKDPFCWSDNLFKLLILSKIFLQD